MPWKSGTCSAATAGLRHAAAAGEFAPSVWNDGIMTNKDGGCAIFGCGWGQVAWTIAVFLGGANYARQMLPVGTGQTSVNNILWAAGLTRAEIKFMEPQAVWEHFDSELNDAYEAREDNPEAFIEASIRLAEFFVQVLETVPEVEPTSVVSRSDRSMTLMIGRMVLPRVKTLEFVAS